MSWVLFSQKQLCNITQTLECFGAARSQVVKLAGFSQMKRRKGTSIYSRKPKAGAKLSVTELTKCECPAAYTM